MLGWICLNNRRDTIHGSSFRVASNDNGAGTLNSECIHGALVSVIVPTFQRTDYLRHTLVAILSQTHQALEVIVVSDGADSTTEELVASFGDRRLVYCWTKHAGFPAVPRNEGLRRCRGDLIAFCDDDDVWYPNKLQRQIDCLFGGAYGMCTTEYNFIDSQGAKLPRVNHFAGYHGSIEWPTFFGSMGFICNSAVLFTREVYQTVGGLNESPSLRAHEDYEYWMRVLMKFPGFFLDETLVGYRIHDGSIQRNVPSKVLSHRIALHRHLRRTQSIPTGIYAKKIVKLWVQYVFDRFPWTKSTWLQWRYGGSQST
jgi:glycosyltransferase involved in cell wall biosynthesis